ncbi:hypothetical protein EYF80_058098 [Liparis tanakae]|uniref:Uncharacterized protein n=1 Tax=Liparis tanakae TaxID=230148 RepID=A0A4Z2ESC7_9TELE|nr:hypothetical protein EYF80_058098 [Liparis tanakae]
MKMTTKRRRREA